jgi:hypothetical protein
VKWHDLNTSNWFFTWFLKSAVEYKSFSSILYLFFQISNTKVEIGNEGETKKGGRYIKCVIQKWKFFSLNN